MDVAKLRWRGQFGKSVLLDDVYVPGGNSATSIDIIAEVGARHRLEGLRLTEIGVATGHNSTGVDIANQNAHRRARDANAIVSG